MVAVLILCLMAGLASAAVALFVVMVTYGLSLIGDGLFGILPMWWIIGIVVWLIAFMPFYMFFAQRA